MQQHLSIVLIFIWGWFSTPEKVHMKLQKSYESDPAKCEALAKKWIADKQKRPIAYYFLAQLYLDQANATESLNTKYARLGRAITYAYKVQKSDTALLFDKNAWLNLCKTLLSGGTKLQIQLEKEGFQDKANLLASKLEKLENKNAVNRKNIELPEVSNEQKLARFNGGQYFGLPSGTENIPSFSVASEKELVAILNKARVAKGMGELVWEEDLARAARYHAYDLATQNYFSHSTHDSINGELVLIAGAFDRIRKFYTAGFVNSENIAAGNKGGEATYIQWYNSPGHYKNMFNPSSKKVGVGVFYNPNSTFKYYWAFCTALD